MLHFHTVGFRMNKVCLKSKFNNSKEKDLLQIKLQEFFFFKVASSRLRTPASAFFPGEEGTLEGLDGDLLEARYRRFYDSFQIPKIVALKSRSSGSRRNPVVPRRGCTVAGTLLHTSASPRPKKREWASHVWRTCSSFFREKSPCTPSVFVTRTNSEHSLFLGFPENAPNWIETRQ